MVKPSAYPPVKSPKQQKRAGPWHGQIFKMFARILSLIRGLAKTRLENYTILEKNNETMSIAQKLADMRQLVEDDILVVILLSGLITAD